MRILYDHQVFSLQSMGGVSRYYYELLRQFSRMESCRPEIAMGIHSNGFNFGGLARVKAWGFHGLATIPPGKTRYLANELFSAILMPFRGEFDVYHPTHFRHVRTARWKKMVVAHQDCAYERYPSLFNRVEMVKRLRMRQFETADAILCPSEATRRDLHEFYDVPESKTFVIYYGVTQLGNHPAAGEFRRDRPFLLYVGSRAPYKNFPTLLRGFSAAGLESEFDIVVAGGGGVTHAETTLLREAGLVENVQFIPRVTDALLAQLYQQARLFVCPSLCEGFGFPPLEAMSFGCQVLVSRTSCLPEICRTAAFYFEVDDLESLVCSLRMACLDESERAAKVREAKSLVASYSWEKCAAGTLAVYKQ